MASSAKDNMQKKISARKRSFTVSIAHKLVLSFLLISIITNVIFTIAGIRLMANRVVAEAQERIRNDLNAAREIYLSEARHINDVIRLNARRPITQDALLSGTTIVIVDDLINVRQSEGLDILTLTDEFGDVVLRTNAPYNLGDNLAQDEVINAAR